MLGHIFFLRDAGFIPYMIKQSLGFKGLICWNSAQNGVQSPRIIGYSLRLWRSELVGWVCVCVCARVWNMRASVWGLSFAMRCGRRNRAASPCLLHWFLRGWLDTASGGCVLMNVCYCSRHTSALRNNTEQNRPGLIQTQSPLHHSNRPFQVTCPRPLQTERSCLESAA